MFAQVLGVCLLGELPRNQNRRRKSGKGHRREDEGEQSGSAHRIKGPSRQEMLRVGVRLKLMDRRATGIVNENQCVRIVTEEGSQYQLPGSCA